MTPSLGRRMGAISPSAAGVICIYCFAFAVIVQTCKDVGPSPFAIPAPQQHQQGQRPPVDGRGVSVHAAAVMLVTDDKWAEDYYDLQRSDSEPGSSAFSRSGDSTASSGVSQHFTSCMAGVKKYSSLLVAMLMCQVGMILFNLGLTYGFAALGDMTGVTLPAAFLAVNYDSKSPYYSFAGDRVMKNYQGHVFFGAPVPGYKQLGGDGSSLYQGP